jgi:hypothetical protein
MINVNARLQGDYNVVIKRGDGKTEETGWFKNLILNQGLDRLGSTGQVISYGQVGSGTNAPAITDTQLQTYVASSEAQFVASSATNSGSPDYYAELTWAFRFPQGSVVAIISEVGVGWDNSAGANLFSRALILDGLGNPTTLSVTAEDELFVYYRLRIYPPLTDVTGSLTIGSASYPYTIRLANANNFGVSIFTLSSAETFSGYGYAYTYQAGATLGSITDSGLSGSYTNNPSPSSASAPPSSSGVYRRDISYTWGINDGNGPGGFQGILFGVGQSYAPFVFQMYFNDLIPKNNTKQFNLTMRFSWARL